MVRAQVVVGAEIQVVEEMRMRMRMMKACIDYTGVRIVEACQMGQPVKSEQE